MGCLKPIIKPFDSGWNYIQHIIIKLISFIMICSCKCGNMSRNKITSFRTSINWIYSTALNLFHQRISKPHCQKQKNHSKTSSGAGRFSQNFCECKKSRINERNCKSGRHNQQYTFMNCKSQHKTTKTNMLYIGVKVQNRNKSKTKPPSPCR